MGQSIFYMAADYEAPKFCAHLGKRCIEKIINRHFVYSLLIADSVIIPVGCYYESPIVQRLVDKYHLFFLPYSDEAPIAGLGLGDDRASFAEDAKIKASWFPEPYSFKDENKISFLSRKIEDIAPTIRSGKMRSRLTANILSDIANDGKSFNVIADSSSYERAAELVKPLKKIVTVQEYAMLPPYIDLEMDRNETLNDNAQKRWLDFILFKNYALSCENSYKAFCNNPFSIHYSPQFKEIYPFYVDSRDTRLFEKFIKFLPFRGLSSLFSLSPEELFEFRNSQDFRHYIYCYERIIHKIKSSLSIYILQQNYKPIAQEFSAECRRELDLYAKRLTFPENVRDAEILYRVLGRPFLNPKSNTERFRKWAANRETDIPMLSILADIEDTEHGILSKYIDELSAVVRYVRRERRKSMKSDNKIINLFGKTTVQNVNSNNIVMNAPCTDGSHMDEKTTSKKNTSGAQPVCSVSARSIARDPTSTPKTNRRFAVALSFPGEFRSIVSEIADSLSLIFGRDRILYDLYYQAEFARPDLDLYLQQLYANEADLIAVFLCHEYDEKSWCGLEWRAIRTLLNDKDSRHQIMFIQCGPGKVDGVFGTVDGKLPAVHMTPQKIADSIKTRYECEYNK